MALARTVGFDDVRDATPEVNERHFAGRRDGLRCFETIVTASRRESDDRPITVTSKP